MNPLDLRMDLDRAARRLDRASPGWALVHCAPGQQEAVAAALAERVPGAVRRGHVPLDELLGPGCVIVAGMGPEPTMREWNGRREVARLRGTVVVVVVDRQGRRDFARICGDLDSALQTQAEVHFVVDPAITIAGARRDLAASLARRLGKLDLRGFVRRESEDVSPAVDTLWVEPELRVDWPGHDAPQAAAQEMAAAVLSVDGGARRSAFAWLRKARELQPGRPIVLRGGPGSGKSFLLRKLALDAARAKRSLLGIPSPIPVLSSLSGWTRWIRLDPLWDHLRQELAERGVAAAHVFEPAGDAGKLLFLLDGLDEVGDASARRATVAGVEELQARFPRCTVIVTSRVPGYAEAPLRGPHAEITPFDDARVRRYLVQFSAASARERLGADREADGRREGEKLATAVLGRRSVLELARSPLMATVLALAHRQGLRLPDHRVELYEHAMRILVERWNSLRSGADARVPLRVSDAVRLLGPIAIDAIETDARGTLSEDRLLSSIRASLSRAAIPGLADAPATLALFRDRIGLLVETGPGSWGFLHLTLAEHMAAWELVRTRKLEELVASGNALLPRWKEAILLACGILGLIQADDDRLDAVVEGICGLTRSSHIDPDAAGLMFQLLLDDPALTDDAFSRLADTYVRLEYAPVETFSTLAIHFSPEVLDRPRLRAALEPRLIALRTAER